MNGCAVDTDATLRDAEAMRRYLADFATLAPRLDVLAVTSLVACDGPCVVRCGPDGGVWTVRTCNPKCGTEWRAVGND